MEFMSGVWTVLRRWEAAKWILAGIEATQDGEWGAVYKIFSNHLPDRIRTMCRYYSGRQYIRLEVGLKKLYDWLPGWANHLNWHQNLRPDNHSQKGIWHDTKKEIGAEKLLCRSKSVSSYNSPGPSRLSRSLSFTGNCVHLSEEQRSITKLQLIGRVYWKEQK